MIGPSLDLANGRAHQEAERAWLSCLGRRTSEMLARSQLIVDVVRPFLDEKPPLPDKLSATRPRQDTRTKRRRSNSGPASAAAGRRSSATIRIAATTQPLAAAEGAALSRLRAVRDMYTDFGQPSVRRQAASSEATYWEESCGRRPSGSCNQVVANSVPDTQATHH